MDKSEPIKKIEKLEDKILLLKCDLEIEKENNFFMFDKRTYKRKPYLIIAVYCAVLVITGLIGYTIFTPSITQTKYQIERLNK